MRRRLVLVTLILASLTAEPARPQSTVPAADSQIAPASSDDREAPPAAATRPEEYLHPDLSPTEQADAISQLNELRGAVRVAPDSAEDRLRLAQALYRFGDLDAALDECRVALKLDRNNARAHWQLGVILMTKQDWRSAATALMEATLLDPGLTQAHYSLGSVQYSLGNLNASIQSYRRAIELQPHFPDARYRLALVLTLANKHREAAQFMEEAAAGGVPQAQYFLGNAYLHGQGVEKNLARAIAWWAKAVELSHLRAAESLSQLRRQALAPNQPERRRREVLAAFVQYREGRWASYPDLTRNSPEDSLGATLIKGDLAANGVAELFAEALALSEPASAELARLYESGLDTRLARFDRRILACLETTAGDGFGPAKIALARIFGKGLGVTRDPQKVRALLKGLPKQEMKAILDEIAAP
jgi:TPR repeat protein